MASKAKRLMDKSEQREKEAEAAVAEKAEAVARRAQEAYDNAIDELETEAGTVIRVAQALVPSPGDSAVKLEEVRERTRHLNLAVQMAMGETPVEHRRQVDELERKLDEATRTLETRNRELRKATEANSDLEKRLEKAEEERDQLRSRASGLARENEAAEKTIGQLEDERDQLAQDLDEARETIDNFEAKRKRAREALYPDEPEPDEPEPTADELEDEPDGDSVPEGEFDGDEPLTNADRALNGTNGDKPSLWERVKRRSRERERRNREYDARSRKGLGMVGRMTVGS